MTQVVEKTPVLRVVATNLLVLALIIVLLEGIAGFVLFTGRLARASELAERRHTRYDPLLGWVNIPGVVISDMYGPGIHLRINNQGFRNEHDFDRQVPTGRTRLVCSGDSFTLGYGVRDDQTWCQTLTRIDPRLETVNMGQGGYGFDQAYLWYKRDGSVLEHQVQVFAFIGDDFDRMGASDFQGYRKPVLKAVNGQLVAEGVPVPGPENGFVHRVVDYAAQLNTIRLAGAIGRSIGLARQPPPHHESISETRSVVAGILDDLLQLNAGHSSRLVLLMLPIQEEIEAGESGPWKTFIREEAARRNIPFVDALSAFGSVPAPERAAMFIQKGALDFPGASGHLTSRGNELAARLVYDAIKDFVTSR